MRLEWVENARGRNSDSVLESKSERQFFLVLARTPTLCKTDRIANRVKSTHIGDLGSRYLWLRDGLTAPCGLQARESEMGWNGEGSLRTFRFPPAL